ncbi:phage distal tail protein [Lacicoccus qingdaonensis]|uniref:Phage-related protein n=1 Tax=Lacicoccus qingdaonensis TaxID=576118 RepID=A0A1G9F302_9BACL|nr:phage tail domain-containing protein [Salinicoccus qingdaonensis]SDK82728.1 Phage-related protein [Salinicoccus qingdaonensis]
MNFSYNGQEDELFAIQEGFTFPSFSKQVQYHESTHSDFRRKRRQNRQPFTFQVPIILLQGRDRIFRDDLTARLSRLLYSDGPEIFKAEDTNWYFIGEFTGPFYIPPHFDKFTTTEVQFVSPYSHKFYDEERTQTTGTTTKRVTINSKTQIPTVPLIELTGLSGNDVQVSISEDSFRRIRLSGNLPENLTIDIENETIYETNSGLDRLNLLRIDSAFEDFKIKNGDVVVLTNASDTAQAKLTYKELLL